MKTSSKKQKLTRTVKISDELHHIVRVRAVQKSVPMQEEIEKLITSGLRKAGVKFDKAQAVAA